VGQRTDLFTGWDGLVHANHTVDALAGSLSRVDEVYYFATLFLRPINHHTAVLLITHVVLLFEDVQDGLEVVGKGYAVPFGI
jgi:hypothetical protein